MAEDLLEAAAAFLVVLFLAPGGIWLLRLAKQWRRPAAAAGALMLVFGVNTHVQPPPPPQVEAEEHEEETAGDDEPK